MKNVFFILVVCSTILGSATAAEVKLLWDYNPPNKIGTLIADRDANFIFDKNSSIMIDQNNGEIDTLENLNLPSDLTTDLQGNAFKVIDTNTLFIFNFYTNSITKKDISFIDFGTNKYSALNTNIIAVFDNPTAGTTLYDIDNKTILNEFSLATHYPNNGFKSSPSGNLALFHYGYDFFLYNAKENKIEYKTFFDTDTFSFSYSSFVNDSVIIFGDLERTICINALNAEPVCIIQKQITPNYLYGADSLSISNSGNSLFLFNYYTGATTDLEPIDKNPILFKQTAEGILGFFTSPYSIYTYNYNTKAFDTIYQIKFTIDSNKIKYFPAYVNEELNTFISPDIYESLYKSIDCTNTEIQSDIPNFYSILYYSPEYYFALKSYRGLMYKVNSETNSIIDSLPPISLYPYSYEDLNDKYLLAHNYSTQMYNIFWQYSREPILATYGYSNVYDCASFDKINPDAFFSSNMLTLFLRFLPDTNVVFTDTSGIISNISTLSDNKTVFYTKSDNPTLLYKHNVFTDYTETISFDINIDNMFISKDNYFIALVDTDTKSAKIYKTKYISNKELVAEIPLLYNNLFFSDNFKYVFSRTINDDDCKFNCYQIIFDDTDAVIDEPFNRLTMNLSPNPADNELSISTNSGELIEKIEIFNNLGQSISVYNNVLSPSFRIDISKYSIGTYYAVINGITKTFIKVGL